MGNKETSVPCEDGTGDSLTGDLAARHGLGETAAEQVTPGAGRPAARVVEPVPGPAKAGGARGCVQTTRSAQGRTFVPVPASLL